MKYLAIIMAIICRCACAQSDYGGILTNMVTALKQNGGTLNASFANQLASSAGEITNAVHLSNINLGKKGRTLLYKFYCICLTIGCGIL
jgi:hypothetical protein